MRMLIIALTAIIYIIDYVSGQACSAYGTSVACNGQSQCTWVGDLASGQCSCASEVKLDILFGVDTSGSIGWNGFQVQKDFVSGLVQQGIANSSKIGFFMFNTNINKTEDIHLWTDQTVLKNFVDGMYWTRGWTNTPQLISDALIQFDATKDPTRQQVFIIITDGNPCLPDSQGGCPQSACQYQTQVYQAGIRVVVIGVGDGLDTRYVKCLTQTDNDWIEVSGYSQAAFDTIIGSLSEILCPVSKEFKVTEVKAMKKTTTSQRLTDSRLGRFVEVWNSGIDFNISDIQIEGLISMTMGAGPSAEVLQSQYVVFYDASDPPLPASSDYSTPTCHLCEWDAANNNRPCDLSSCSPAVLGTADSYTRTCFCDNSVYVACGNADDGSAGCDANVIYQRSQGKTVVDACSSCTFVGGTTMDKTNWDITFTDTPSDSSKFIDKVEYGAVGTGSWITPFDGYSLELAYVGFDNDYGTSWIQSCSEFGTPGSDPYAQCDETCVTLGSDCGGTGTCDATTGQCLCDATTGYYPSCQGYSSSGATGCFQCAETPTVSECVVVWRKNGTDKYAYYNWTTNQPSVNGGFFLNYFASAKGGQCPTGVVGGGYDSDCDVSLKEIGQFNKDDAIFSPFQRVNGYYGGNDTVGGFVYAFEAICDTPNLATADTCQYYVSDAIPCIVITAAPTASPTAAPTNPPTPEPTNDPTMSPTFACPRYWIDDDKVCNSNEKKYFGDRCSCTSKAIYGSTQTCCLLEPDFDVFYDDTRTHKLTDECKLDAQLDDGGKDRNKVSKVYDYDEETTPGYLLTEGDHEFQVTVSDEARPCNFTICWEIVMERTDCNYDDRRRLQDGSITCSESSTSLAAAGLEIDVTKGCLEAETQSDVQNLLIQFEVTRLDCDEAEDALDGDDTTTTSYRRRLGNDDCFDSVAIYGKLRLVNASSDCQPGCYDGRIYPMEVPIWYNYDEAFVAPPSEEKELPAWLWWLIAALVVFLALLALLVYKYWWKNKATGAALGATQADLDAAVMENENGFGGDLGNGQVGFNPLATGFNPNAPAGAANPNAPPGGHPGQGDFIRPNVEKPVFRQEFGQKMGGDMR